MPNIKYNAGSFLFSVHFQSVIHSQDISQPIIYPPRQDPIIQALSRSLHHGVHVRRTAPARKQKIPNPTHNSMPCLRLHLIVHAVHIPTLHYNSFVRIDHCILNSYAHNLHTKEPHRSRFRQPQSSRNIQDDMYSTRNEQCHKSSYIPYNDIAARQSQHAVYRPVRNS